MWMPLGVRFGKTELCAQKEGVRFRKDGYSRTQVYNVILWDDACILGLSAILWRCDSINVIVYYGCTLCLA